MDKTLDTGNLDELVERIKDMLLGGASMVVFSPDPEDSEKFSTSAILAMQLEKLKEDTEEAAGMMKCMQFATGVARAMRYEEFRQSVKMEANAFLDEQNGEGQTKQ